MPDSPPFTEADLQSCERVLRTLADDRSLLIGVSDDRRKALLEWAGRLIQPTDEDLRAIARAKRRRSQAQAKERRSSDVKAKAQAQQRVMRAAANAAVNALPMGSAPSEPAAAATPEGTPSNALHEELHCYICKVSYRTVHPFYASMCTACGDFNFSKRAPRGDLTGKVAVITGARVKIGFHASMLLLRNGCRVVVTTRFPRDAAARYAREPDFEDFRARLQIFGLDLRHAPSVELLSRYLDTTLPRLDFLINNAAQTVRRPPAFYAHLIAGETAPSLGALPPPAQELLSAHEALSASLSQRQLGAGAGLVDAESVLGAWGGDSAGAGVWASAQLSQLPYAEEEPLGAEMFPVARMDSDLQQVDRRSMNSWRLKAADVPTPELLEVHLVNAIAPFLLNARLKALMARDRTGDKHIVNVSAMEGIFGRGPKTDRHPHTNMAKAALNMFTRTSAADYLKHGIHMNSVDTGWVTDEDPLPIAERKERELDFQPPLDAVDGAARIVDPIFSGLATGEHVWGKFLKDYRPAPW